MSIYQDTLLYQGDKGKERKGKKEKKLTFQITSSLSSHISDSMTNMSWTALFSIPACLIYCIGKGCLILME